MFLQIWNLGVYLNNLWNKYVFLISLPYPEVETTWISLIGWSLRTSISYTSTSLVHHILCIVKHVGMKIIAFTVTSKQTLYALNHYVLLSVLPKMFTQIGDHSCRVKMDYFPHRGSGDNGIKNGFPFDIQTRIRTIQCSRDLEHWLTSEFMGKTFQAAQLTHERFLTIDHSFKIFFWYLPNWTSTDLWYVVLYLTYSTTHQRSVEV